MEKMSSKKFLLISILINIILVSVLIYDNVDFKKPKYPPNNASNPEPYYLNFLINVYQNIPSTQDEIIFIGNSHVFNFPWEEYLPNLNIRNRGIGGETTAVLEKRIPLMIHDKVDKIVLIIGSNDINKKVPQKNILQNYTGIIKNCVNSAPDAEIIAVGIIPRPDDELRNVLIRRINPELKKIAEAVPNGKFLDVYEELYKHRENWYYDKIHLNSEGYLFLVEQLKPYLGYE